MADHEIRATVHARNGRVVVRVDIAGEWAEKELGASTDRSTIGSAATVCAENILERMMVADEDRTAERKRARKCMAALRAHLGADNGNGPSEDDDE